MVTFNVDTKVQVIINRDSVAIQAGNETLAFEDS